MTIELRQKLKSIIGARGGAWHDLPVLLPAGTLLELAGETLRPRLYFTSAPNGQEYCLRADLTIPAALYYLENFPANKDFTLLCEGKVFRAPIFDGEGAEFTQIGIEKFGSKDIVQSDTEVFLSAFDACKSANLAAPMISFSDGALIEKILNCETLLPVWRSFLRNRSKSKSALEDGIKIAMEHTKGELSILEKKLVGQSKDYSQIIVSDLIKEASLHTGPARSIEDIITRVQNKINLKTTEALDKEYGTNLLELLKVNDEPFAALEKIVELGKSLSLDLNDWAMAWEQRLSIIQNDVEEGAASMSFYSISEARFEYYDGMIFEIASAANPSSPVAFGGRYDGLISALSNGENSASAVGAVIRPERLGGFNKNV